MEGSYLTTYRLEIFHQVDFKAILYLVKLRARQDKVELRGTCSRPRVVNCYVRGQAYIVTGLSFNPISASMYCGTKSLVHITMIAAGD